MTTHTQESSAIIVLPPARWREARQLRLEALQSAPAAFASSYADELAFTDEVWQSRLRSAYQRAGNLTLFAESAGALVGMAGATWSQKAKLRHVATVYGVYVPPAWRGRGIGARLLRALLAELQSMPQIEKLSLTVNRASQPAIRLYQRLGFESVGIAQRELKVDGLYYDLQYMELFLP